MSDLSTSVLFAIAVSSGVILLLRPWRRATEASKSPRDLKMENFIPRHSRYFAQVRQALSALDQEYLNKKAPRAVARTALRERRAVARQFLAGILEDFTNLERLARMVALLSPVISGEQEAERILLGVRFRLLYGWVWLRLSTGRVPLGQLEELTGLVGRLATRMQEAIAAIGALSAPGLNSGL